MTLKQRTVTWRLTDGRSFTLHVETPTPEAAAEAMFRVTNNAVTDETDPLYPTAQEWAAMGHRSLSVGDNVKVDEQSWYCASTGPEPSTEMHPRSMEDQLDGPEAGL
jgi:hypothetical protein